MTPHQQILIVEDDEAISQLLQLAFKQLGHKVFLAKDRQSALRELKTRSLDIILLDLGLPDGDGKELIKTIRSQVQTPIIVVSARHEEKEIIGAHYLTFIRPDQPKDQFKDCRFAGAAGAQNNFCLARIYFEADVLQNGLIVKPLVYAAKFDHGFIIGER